MAKNGASQNQLHERLIPYVGSKSRMANLIVEALGAHETYVEVFGGSAMVLLSKKPAPIEVYNDINQAVVTFFRVVRDNPEKLALAIGATPYSRVEYEAAIRTLDRREEVPVDDLEVARSLAVLLSQSIHPCMTSQPRNWSSGALTPTGGGGRVASLKNWYETPDRIRVAARRFRNVFIECRDWSYIIRRYDSESTAFYVDPPYLHDTRTRRNRYSDEMQREDHVRLLESLKAVSGHVVVSGYGSELYSKHLHKWETITKTCNTQGTAREERLWIKPRKNLQTGISFLFTVE